MQFTHVLEFMAENLVHRHTVDQENITTAEAHMHTHYNTAKKKKQTFRPTSLLVGFSSGCVIGGSGGEGILAKRRHTREIREKMEGVVFFCFFKEEGGIGLGNFQKIKEKFFPYKIERKQTADST